MSAPLSAATLDRWTNEAADIIRDALAEQGIDFPRRVHRARQRCYAMGA
ncbi:MAG TPA: hypothetical protein PKB14_07750 [Rubrivivax sp.]|nr:hypothetical protein [Rubrivivax sp.]